MRRYVPGLLASLAFAGGMPASLTPIIAAATPSNAANAAFEKLGGRSIDIMVRPLPMTGTQFGDQRFDDKLPNLSAAGRAAAMANDKTLLVDSAFVRL